MIFELITAAGLFSLLFAFVLAYSTLRKDQGNEKMRHISAVIQQGAKAYLNRQYKTVAVFAALLTVVLYFAFGTVTALSFAFGAVLSALAGYIGMIVAVKSNARTAKAAEKGLNSAMSVALRAGAVNGFAIVGLGLLGVTALFAVYGDPKLIVGFAFGASLISLFARVGGGIYTKAADVGADLVGKLEKGIPEDDPRNPAVIADNVGDNVGDCAGMGADLFESYVVTIIAAMILGASLGFDGVIFPLLVAVVGIIASVIGIFVVRAKKEKEIWPALNRGLIVSALLAAIGSYAISIMFMNSTGAFLSVLSGLITAVLISQITEYYTSKEKKPVQEIALSSETGAATNVIAGLAAGMKSTILPVIVISLAVIASYSFAGVYGIALSVMGLLSITGIIMAIDTFGPITDNAGGIAEMAKLGPGTRKVTDALDAVGNTTKATTKGIAIASAALSALALLAAFTEASGLISIDITKPTVLVGLLIGAAIPFLFSAYLMRAVGKAAHLIVKEVRRQFKEIKGIMSGKAQPDYAKAVDISTQAALRELAMPGLIAVLGPVLVGLLLGAEALGAMLAGSVASGLLLALMLANAGGAWDNAKKYIESGHLGGKGSGAHKAAVVGDTVGDPCKDTCGPAINSLIKTMNTLSIVIAPLLLTLI
ncbi:MAG: sodium-translocating pyrophosphatase [Candidatus Aenigmarchaeota archaeon]|nr:sodium-translocating pyrophosphatase [Candidatus Aenigmarchaeota archaeon]